MMSQMTAVITVDGFYFLTYSLLIMLSILIFRNGLDWKLGLASRFETPEQLARSNFLLNVSMSVLLAVVLLGGIVVVDGVPDHYTFLVPASDYSIDDVWHVVGLAGTGSNDIVIDGLVVPEAHTASMLDISDTSHSSRKSEPTSGAKVSTRFFSASPW